MRKRSAASSNTLKQHCYNGLVQIAHVAVEQMDAPIDRDVKVNKASAVIIADFKRRLPLLLHVGDKLQARVSISENEGLLATLQPLQEWPQLLDSHLSSILTPLVTDFLASLEQKTEILAEADNWHYNVYTAISKLIYTFCKIRGAKVVVRFLNNEPRYIEPMLSAYEYRSKLVLEHTWLAPAPAMLWEERYIMLLWISHLMLTPFDLKSIDSNDLHERSLELTLPDDLPDVAIRILAISLPLFEKAGKERETAVLAVVRLSTRPDMVSCGLLRAVVSWSLEMLQPTDAPVKQIYFYASILSFLARALASGPTVLDRGSMKAILGIARKICDDDREPYSFVRSSALSRKTLIKLFRAATVLILPGKDIVDLGPDVLEDVIERLLNYLGDNDTPVRLAASKALSMIAAKLDPSLAAEIVEAVVGSLEEDVLWTSGGKKVRHFDVGVALNKGDWKMDLSAVNALRWHGLTLTLAQILFRRSSPPQLLPSVINALLQALQFEQRSSTGAAIGVNVRDAACFGIWSLSRRYKSAELLNVHSRDILAAGSRRESMSVIQLLAAQLLISGCLDPSGNIRRGSSAALQELVGRHPDAIAHGIPLVQTVDYHAVSLRSNAITQVAIQAAELDPIYWHAIFDHILGWKGSDSNDTQSRRIAGDGVRNLAEVDNGTTRALRLAHIQQQICDRLRQYRIRNFQPRHGLLLALSGLVKAEAFSDELQSTSESNKSADLAIKCWNVFTSSASVSAESLKVATLQPDLLCEAACKYVSSALESTSAYRALNEDTYGHFLTKSIEILSASLLRWDETVIIAAAETAKVLFSIVKRPLRSELVEGWLSVLQNSIGSKARCTGHVAALGAVFESCNKDSDGLSVEQGKIIAGLGRLIKSGNAIEPRVACIQAFGEGILVHGIATPEMIDSLMTALDDYTIDSRGDIGSWMRLEAIDSILIGVENDAFNSPSVQQRYQDSIPPRILRLAGERLDKVRYRAWQAVTKIWKIAGPSCAIQTASDTISSEYFSALLSNFWDKTQRVQLLQGICSSASLGSEALVVAARHGLGQYISTLEEPRLSSFCTTLLEMLGNNGSSEKIAGAALLTIGFLFDADIIQNADLKWNDVFTIIANAHFKTKSLARLDGAVRSYAGMLQIKIVRRKAATKLVNMLLHPMPRVRNQCADVLYANLLVDGIEQKTLDILTRHDWGESTTHLKPAVISLKELVLQI